MALKTFISEATKQIKIKLKHICVQTEMIGTDHDDNVMDEDY